MRSLVIVSGKSVSIGRAGAEELIRDGFDDIAQSITCHRDALLVKLGRFIDDKLCILGEKQLETLDKLMSDIRTAVDDYIF